MGGARVIFLFSVSLAFDVDGVSVEFCIKPVKSSQLEELSLADAQTKPNFSALILSSVFKF